jgi:hydroxymethylglutaryl-CoA lyase
VSERLAEIGSEIDLAHVALHFHDTRGTALANIIAGLDAGVRVFDSAIAGLGGCPYAPGAAGNVATEDLVQMFEGMGIHTGVDLQALLEAALFMEEHLGKKLPGRYLRASRHHSKS